MSQEEQVVVEDAGVEEAQERRSGEEAERLVRVSEAIRYRRRAQAAERQVRQLEAQLETQEAERQEAQSRAAELERQQEWSRALAQAGAVDVEAAVLLLERRLAGEPGEAAGAIEALRRERPWLFGGGGEVSLAGPTAGAQRRESSGTGLLRQAGERARQSGHRRDVQEYLRLRRSVRH